MRWDDGDRTKKVDEFGANKIVWTPSCSFQWLGKQELSGCNLMGIRYIVWLKKLEIGIVQPLKWVKKWKRSGQSL